MPHLALLSHRTQAIKNSKAIFQTVSLRTRVNKLTMHLAIRSQRSNGHKRALVSMMPMCLFGCYVGAYAVLRSVKG